MQRKLYKELWTMRFQKMLALEERGIRDYQSLLEECGSKHTREAPFRTYFEQLISDETKHARLVKELLEIVNRQED